MHTLKSRLTFTPNSFCIRRRISRMVVSGCSSKVKGRPVSSLTVTERFIVTSARDQHPKDSGRQQVPTRCPVSTPRRVYWASSTTSSKKALDCQVSTLKSQPGACFIALSHCSGAVDRLCTAYTVLHEIVLINQFGASYVHQMGQPRLGSAICA